ncbi:MAG: M14 family metallopeptidase [Bacteriovoracales bacterium]|nr:M14 family metallopeptidase [Bacteriovoracales bacterium]
MKGILGFVFATCWGFSLLADDTYFVHLKAYNVDERSGLAEYIHIDEIIEDDVYTTVNAHDLALLEAFHWDKIVEAYPLAVDGEAPGFSNEYDFPAKDDDYHNYDEVLRVIDDLVEEYPHIVESFSLGTTVEGRMIPLIRITHRDNRPMNFFVPGILFIGSHHAREHLSTEVPLLLAQHLADSYDSDPTIRKLIETRDIYIAPVLNIDGKLYDIKGKKYKRWRKNRAVIEHSKARGVDLNRNYSYGWGTGGSSKNPGSDVYMGPKPFSEPETEAIKNFIETAPHIRILLSYHTYGELILYPWGGSKNNIGGRDQKIFEKMAWDMSQWNGYTPMKSSDLYIASGDTCDWAYGVHQIYCFTFELSPRGRFFGGGFYPGEKIIDAVFRENIGPALYLMDYSDDPSRILSNGI